MTNQRAIVLLSQMYIPAFDEEEKEAITKAIEALTEQEPRILTPVEYKEWCVGNRKTPLLIERKRIHKKKHEMYWLNAPEGAVHVDEEYGNSFVVWTGWLSDVQQKAVEWE